MLRIEDAILIFILSCFTSTSAAELIVKTRYIDDEHTPENGYESANLAAVAATNRYNPNSVRENREHVGGILKCNQDRFFYTHGQGDIATAPVKFSVSVPAGCQLIAFWHTHGGRFESREYFSPADTRTAQTTGKPFYMADYRGALKVFNPDDRIYQTARVRGTLRLPKGAARGQSVQDESGERVRVATR